MPTWELKTELNSNNKPTSTRLNSDEIIAEKQKEDCVLNFLQTQIIQKFSTNLKTFNYGNRTNKNGKTYR
jgi:hypothetical protein